MEGVIEMQKIKVTENYSDTTLVAADYISLRKILRSVWSKSQNMKIWYYTVVFITISYLSSTYSFYISAFQIFTQNKQRAY